MAADRPGPIERVEVVPVGSLDGSALRETVRLLSRDVGVPCSIGDPLSLRALPLVPAREQVDADALLAALESLGPEPGTALLGLTAHDLGHKLFTFFFGRARVGGAAIVSLRRLDPGYYGMPPDHETMLRRAVRECLHELGHVGGLRHCEDYACVMSFSGDAETLDVRGRGFCRDCAGLLGTSLGLHEMPAYRDWL